MSIGRGRGSSSARRRWTRNGSGSPAFYPAREYVEQYRHIDIALDPFPYPGGTTTFDALWMGVPVVSLAGKTAVSRRGLSILGNIGLPELVATSIEQYHVAIAAGLASALPRLAELRSGLRDRMKRSPLMDAPRFARDVEGAFDQMWEPLVPERDRQAA